MRFKLRLNKEQVEYGYHDVENTNTMKLLQYVRQFNKYNQFDKEQMVTWEHAENKKYNAATTYFKTATAESKKFE